MIRTVPGGNLGPGGGSGCDDAVSGDATGDSLLYRPRKSAAPTTATSTSREMPTIHGMRLPLPGGVGGSNGAVVGTGGARTGEDCTATPGPTGVATSDQLLPLHHRTIPAAPSGSGYHPGAGCAGPVTPPP